MPKKIVDRVQKACVHLDAVLEQAKDEAKKAPKKKIAEMWKDMKAATEEAESSCNLINQLVPDDELAT